jgi:hypothetical protein
VGMTRPGAWRAESKGATITARATGSMAASSCRRAGPKLAIGVRAAVTDHLGRAPTRAELIAARRAAHSLAALRRARVHPVPRADADDNAGDRNYLVLARPNVIMNDTGLRGLGVADSRAASRRSPHNHEQRGRQQGWAAPRSLGWRRHQPPEESTCRPRIRPKAMSHSKNSGVMRWRVEASDPSGAGCPGMGTR